MKRLNLDGSYTLDKETRRKMVGFMIGDVMSIREAATQSFQEHDPAFLSKVSHRASFTLSILQDESLDKAIAEAKKVLGDHKDSITSEGVLEKLLERCDYVVKCLELENA